MTNARVVYLICIFLGAGLSANGQSASKCFRADWLQGERVVNFRLNGSKVTGTFAVGSGGDETSPDASYEFSGTLRGTTLTVAFDDNKLPDVAPSEMKSLLWTLARSGDKETLRIKFRGKNYETNKYEVRFADFASCGNAGYAALAKTAHRVRFVRGTNSANIPVSFKAKDERKSFLLNMKAGQQIEVEAHGCTISYYYPNKKDGEEPAIDTWSPGRLTQSGDYLFVISPAPEPGNYSVKFKVKN